MKRRGYESRVEDYRQHQSQTWFKFREPIGFLVQENVKIKSGIVLDAFQYILESFIYYFIYF